jgi:LPXTG-motif cell wall-anchored protein
MKHGTKLGRVGRKLAAVAGVCVVGVAIAPVFAGADAPDADPAITTQVVVNGDNSITVTLSGTWKWTTHNSDCNVDRYAVGWEVDWNDGLQPGNPIGATGIDVGAAVGNAYNAADNVVDYYTNPPRCGTYDAGVKYNSGSWGPISHTYAPGTDTESINPCVVTYDLHNDKGGVKLKDLNAGGSDHNKDNSVEANGKTPAGNQCAAIIVPSTLTLKKVVVNDDGGSATVSAFNLTATKVGDLAPTLSGTDGVNGNALGDYVLGETGPGGYTASAWDCGLAPVVDGVVSVFAGQNVVCTVTNNDNPAVTTTTEVGSGLPTTTAARDLPKTGVSNTSTALVAMLFAGLGTFLLLYTRRGRTA